MKSRGCITAALWLALWTTSTGCGGGGDGSKNRADSAGHPPNIIVILADDLGYDDLGCYWTPNDSVGYEKIDTPNVDRMAAEGIRFTDFYAGASVCTASRAALLTGCYPPRVGLSLVDSRSMAVLDRESRMGLNPDEVTIAELLHDQGYATACIGKWHLGDHPKFYPTRHGFDLFYGPMFRRRKGNLIMRGEVVTDTLPDEALTDRYTEEAVGFIEAHRDGPFFLYLAHNMPHSPIAVPARFEGVSARGPYGDAVTNVDWSTGRILDVLDRLGIAEHTLIIFTSDNGPAILRPDGGKAYPLRGGKAWAHEGGFRVPCIVRWPGRIHAGQTREQLTTMMDFLPTFAALAGTAPSGERVIDGKDIGALLFGDSETPSPHEAFFYYRKNGLGAVRQGPWKVMFYGEDSSIPGEPRILHNLDEDITETRDYRDSNPQELQRLMVLADAMRRELGDAYKGIVGDSCRPPGRAR